MVVDCNFACGRGKIIFSGPFRSPARGCRTRVATASSSLGTRASDVAAMAGPIFLHGEKEIGAVGS
jgi:hypothetical protein